MLSRTEWMADGKFGLMVHYLPPGVAVSGAGSATAAESVERFDLPGFIESFDRSGADWLIFTIGQNGGFYCSPNRVLDELAGPGHGFTSTRDLIGEVAAAVKARPGKRFIAYLPSEVRANAPGLRKAFGWSEAEGTDQRLFQERYCRFIEEYAVRLGNALDGWWFDGCYDWAIFNNKLYDWDLWAAASRAGNEQCAMAFNTGAFCCNDLAVLSDEWDYFAGETEVLVEGKVYLGRGDNGGLHRPRSTFVPGVTGGVAGDRGHCRWHALVPIDGLWELRDGPPPDYLPACQRFRALDRASVYKFDEPIYTDDELLTLLEHYHDVGGGVTFNIEISDEGWLAPHSVDQLARLAAVEK